ncbi:MAG: hypothetical protein ABWY37_11535 [Microbacterium pygmaeum]
MTARSLRAVRGVTAAAVATFLAAVSHTLGGGTAPSFPVIAAVALLAAPMATAIVGSRLALWRLAIAVALSQIAFHTAFSVVAGMSPTGSVTSMAHDHTQAALSSAAPSMGATASPLMLLAHAIAAIVSIVILHRGERAARTLLRLVVDVLAARTGEIVPPEGMGMPGPAASVPVRVPLTRLSEVILRRGPPVSLVTS